MEYRTALNTLYDISEYWHRLVNGWGKFGERFLFYGHLYKNREECVAEVGVEEREGLTSEGLKRYTTFVTPEELNDFRAEMVDDEIIICAKEYFTVKVNNFCKENHDGNLQSFFVGCALNLYYISGLFDRCGYLDYNEVCKNINCETTKKYISIIDVALREKVFNCFQHLIGHGLFEKRVLGIYESYLQASSLQEKENYVNQMIECINSNAKEAKCFVKSILDNLNLFESSVSENRDLINEMITVEPKYQYAHLIRCMRSYSKYIETNGADESYKEFFCELDNLIKKDEKSYIMEWATGHKQPSTFECSCESGKIVTKHPGTFSSFGLGVPYITFISKYEYFGKFATVGEDFVIDRKMIRDSIQESIGVPCEVELNQEELLYRNVTEGLLSNRHNEAIKGKLEKLQSERYKIIRDFSHTYDNMQAIGLKEIANILMESSDLKIQQCGRVILAEYGMKDSMKAEVNLLRLNFEESNEGIINLIRQGIHYEKVENENDIHDVFEESLKICLLRIIYSGNPKGEDEIAKIMYKRIKNKVGKMSQFVSAFEKNVIIQKEKVSVFLQKNGIKFELNVSNDWESLFFVKNKHTDVLLRSIFTELITNSMKYADLDSEIVFKLIKNGENYEVLETNKFAERIETESGVGIVSKGELLKKINGYESAFVNEMTNKEGDLMFNVRLLINKVCLDNQKG